MQGKLFVQVHVFYSLHRANFHLVSCSESLHICSLLIAGNTQAVDWAGSLTDLWCFHPISATGEWHSLHCIGIPPLQTCGRFHHDLGSDTPKVHVAMNGP